jgi:hypothetical protein
MLKMQTQAEAQAKQKQKQKQQTGSCEILFQASDSLWSAESSRGTALTESSEIFGAVV